LVKKEPPVSARRGLLALDDRPSVKTEYAADVSLMTLVAANDAAATRALDARLRGRSLRIARSLLRNDADASDATQLGLVEVFRAAATYRGESSIEHWADRIVVRASLRTLAKRRSFRGVLDEDTSPDELPGPMQLRDDSLLDQLGRLPPEQRTVLVLKYTFEYSLEEIAELTGASVNTVKDRLLRGKHALRRVVRRDELPMRAVKEVG
jgi:RNA polymerase sigma-70 factor, ECF subfamily